MSPTDGPKEGSGKKFSELSRIRVLGNSDAKTNGISAAVRNLKLQGQPNIRRSLTFLRNDKIVTPFGLTLNMPCRLGKENKVVHASSSTKHCEGCCCKKAETDLEKLQQEVNDLKEIVKTMRSSNNNSGSGDSIATSSNTTSILFPPPPPPPPPPPMTVTTHTDPLKVLKEARKRKKLLTPVRKEGMLDMTEVLKEMKGITLKQVPRSPGGTPYRKNPTPNKNDDQGSLLARALQKRYESLMSPESSPSKLLSPINSEWHPL